MRQEIKEFAKASLQEKRWSLLLPMLVYSLIGGAVSSTGIGGIVMPLFSIWIMLSAYRFLQTGDTPISFDYFSQSLIYGIVKGAIGMALVIGFSIIDTLLVLPPVFIMAASPVLGIIFLVIGILIAIVSNVILSWVIVALTFPMDFMIYDSDGEMSVSTAVRLSREMMKGRVGEYIVLMLSFLGHFLLNAITFGLYNIWFAPYYYTCLAEYYRRVKAEFVECNIDMDVDQLNIKERKACAKRQEEQRRDFVPPMQGNMPPQQGYGNVPPMQGNMPPQQGYRNVPPMQGNMPPQQGYGNVPPMQGNMPPNNANRNFNQDYANRYYHQNETTKENAFDDIYDIKPRTPTPEQIDNADFVRPLPKEMRTTMLKPVDRRDDNEK